MTKRKRSLRRSRRRKRRIKSLRALLRKSHQFLLEHLRLVIRIA